MKIIYIHHGHRLKGTPPSQKDDLTELGYKDCELVAELLNYTNLKHKIKAIYTSPYFRCAKTAEIINSHLNVKIVEDNRLNEFEYHKKETWLNAQKRITNCLDEIVSIFNNEDIVICVTSGVNIGAFICKAFNIEPSENTPFLGVPSCSPIMFEFKK